MKKNICHELSLADKVKLLKASEVPGFEHQDLVSQFSVSRSPDSCLLKRKAEIYKDFTGCQTHQQKKWNRYENGEDVEDALILWLQEKVDQGGQLDGPLLKAKAVKLAKETGREWLPLTVSLSGGTRGTTSHS